jgi:hypothetical protein
LRFEIVLPLAAASVGDFQERHREGANS